jgi:hypothetical protein
MAAFDWLDISTEPALTAEFGRAIALPIVHPGCKASPVKAEFQESNAPLRTQVQRSNPKKDHASCPKRRKTL